MKALRINPLALGLALGILWGLSMLILGIIAHYFLYGTAFVTAMGALYVGYKASIIGSLIGGLIGFVDAFIGGVIIGWLYNIFAGVYNK